VQDGRVSPYSWLEDFDLARQLLVRGEIRKLREGGGRFVVRLGRDAPLI
jgi:hypothetical protein